MAQIFEKYTLITYADKMIKGAQAPSNIVEYMQANELQRREIIAAGDAHPYGAIDWDKSQVTRYWKTQEAAEAYKEIALANAQKFNVNILKIEILDNTTWDPSQLNEADIKAKFE
jgi:hypothetical protein